MKVKFPYVIKKWQKAYDPQFRNTRENRIKIWEDICSVSYSLFCAAIQKVRCGRAVIDAVLLVVTSVVHITILNFFFFNFVLRIFKYHFRSPLLISVFLILLIFCIKFTYSINRKLYFVTCLIQLKYLCLHIEIVILVLFVRKIYHRNVNIFQKNKNKKDFK